MERHLLSAFVTLCPDCAQVVPTSFEVVCGQGVLASAPSSTLKPALLFNC